MDWRENINTIKEIFPGHFQIILDFATIRFLKHVISDSYNYVWVQSHNVHASSGWESFELPLFSDKKNYSVLVREFNLEFITTTVDFKKLLPNMGPGISIIQLNNRPPRYLDLSKITGKTRYDILQKECNYLFEIDIPSATDYGTLISSNQNFLKALLESKEIDWTQLP